MSAAAKAWTGAMTGILGAGRRRMAAAISTISDSAKIAHSTQTTQARPFRIALSADGRQARRTRCLSRAMAAGPARQPDRFR